jgi:hypothetical protein
VNIWLYLSLNPNQFQNREHFKENGSATGKQNEEAHADAVMIHGYLLDFGAYRQVLLG